MSKDFCKIYQIKHITTAPFRPCAHFLKKCTSFLKRNKISPFLPQSNSHAERFVDTLKRALKKASAPPMEKALLQFLQVYNITPNMKASASQSLAEVMFAG